MDRTLPTKSFHCHGGSGAGRYFRRPSLTEYWSRQRLSQSQGSGDDEENRNGSFLRSRSADQQLTSQDSAPLTAGSCNSSWDPYISSVAGYQQVFQQVKQANNSLSAGALHQKTLIEIAELKAESELKEEHRREEGRRHEEEERRQKQTSAKKMVGKMIDRIVPRKSHCLNVQPLDTHQTHDTDLHREQPRRRASITMIMRRRPAILDSTRTSTRRRTVETGAVTNLLSKVEMACAAHVSDMYRGDRDDMGVNFAPRRSVGGSMHTVRSLDDVSTEEVEWSRGLSDVASEHADNSLSGFSVRVDVTQKERQYSAKKQEASDKRENPALAWVGVTTVMESLPTAYNCNIMCDSTADDSNHIHDDSSSSGLIVGFGSRSHEDDVNDEGGLIVGFGVHSK